MFCFYFLKQNIFSPINLSVALCVLLLRSFIHPLWSCNMQMITPSLPTQMQIYSAYLILFPGRVRECKKDQVSPSAPTGLLPTITVDSVRLENVGQFYFGSHPSSRADIDREVQHHICCASGAFAKLHTSTSVFLRKQTSTALPPPSLNPS